MDQWIKDLVSDEIEISETGSFNSRQKNDTVDLGRQACVFLNEIRKELIEQVQVFNQLRRNKSYRIKMYSISDKQEGFMLFRNHYKMVFCVNSDYSLFITNNSVSSYFSDQKKDLDPSHFRHTIKARKSILNDLTWYFQREKVTAYSLSKYYLTRFIRESFYQ